MARRLTVNDKIEFETADGFYIEIPLFAESKPKNLKAWRKALKSKKIMEGLAAVAKIVREIEFKKRELHDAAGKVGQDVCDLIPWNANPKANFMHMEDANSKNWYHIPVDGKVETAHEALSRYVETCLDVPPRKEKR